MNPSSNDAFDSSAGFHGTNNWQGSFLKSNSDVVKMETISDNNYRKKSKKWMMVLAMVLFFSIVAIIVFILVRSASNTSDDNAIISVLEERRDEVHQVENLFDNINDGEVNFKLLYQESENENLVETALASMKDFKEQIEAISENGLNKEKKALLTELKETLGQRLLLYEKMEEICAVFDDVYNSSNGMLAASELMDNSNEYIASLAKDFYAYFDKNAQITSEIEKNNCSAENATSAMCVKLYDEYYQNEEFLNDGNVLAKIMMEVNGSEEYENAFKMSDLIDEIIYSEDENEK